MYAGWSLQTTDMDRLPTDIKLCVVDRDKMWVEWRPSQVVPEYSHLFVWLS